ncbi:putative divalent ion tolerance protein, CutA [Helianthus debilis subsp. tardiflorus]
MALSRLTSAGVRRRLPLVGAFCMLSLGFHKLHPFSTPPRLSLTGSKAQGYHRTSSIIRMENTVPSIVVYVTVPNKEAGKKLAGSIVKEKLAACVNRVPGIESVYLWEGEIQTDSEELLIIKTRESLLNALTEHVKANHEYDVPEVIALPITGGSIPYLEWLKNSTRE